VAPRRSRWRRLPAPAIALVFAGALAAPAWPQAPDRGMAGLSDTGAATADDTAAAAAPDRIVIRNFAFTPPTLAVRRGTAVTWINRDDDAHTVVAAGAKPLFKSPPLERGESFSFTFAEPGTYVYFCTIHATMKGTVIVQ